MIIPYGVQVGVIGNLVHSSQHIKKAVLDEGALQPVISLLRYTRGRGVGGGRGKGEISSAQGRGAGRGGGGLASLGR